MLRMRVRYGRMPIEIESPMNRYCRAVALPAAAAAGVAAVAELVAGRPDPGTAVTLTQMPPVGKPHAHEAGWGR